MIELSNIDSLSVSGGYSDDNEANKIGLGLAWIASSTALMATYVGPWAASYNVAKLGAEATSAGKALATIWGYASTGGVGVFAGVVLTPFAVGVLSILGDAIVSDDL